MAAWIVTGWGKAVLGWLIADRAFLSLFLILCGWRSCHRRVWDCRWRMCPVGVRRGWTLIFLGSRWLHIVPSPLEHQAVIYKESWVSVCFPEFKECLLHSIENYLRPCWVFLQKYILQSGLLICLHGWCPPAQMRVHTKEECECYSQYPLAEKLHCISFFLLFFSFLSSWATS